MNIKIFYEGVSFRIRNWKKIKRLMVKVISEEGNFSGDLNLILADDNYILNINRRFLNHDWYTDVISFNYGSDTTVNGEIYISVESVKKNAINYKISFNDEILRVILHGVLHICGYEDRNEREKKKMHEIENLWMKRFWVNRDGN